MFTDMDEWVEIRRRVLVDGESKRSIVREFGIHWKTLQKVLAFSEPPGYRRRGDRPQPVIGPHLGVIASILDSDKSVHPKQRHTAKRIFERRLHTSPSPRLRRLGYPSTPSPESTACSESRDASRSPS